MSTLAEILLRTGNMKLPSLMVLAPPSARSVSAVHSVGRTGPNRHARRRRGSLIAFTISTAIMAWYVLSGRARVNFVIKGLRSSAACLRILEVGAVSCRSPLQSVLTVTVFTRMLADFGTEGWPARASARALIHADVDCVRGPHRLGADGRHGDRRGTGRAGAADCGIAAGIVCVGRPDPDGDLDFPRPLVDIFTDDPAVRAASRQYLHTAAPMYAFIGLSISMYFSSQGAAKVLVPVLAQTARLLFVGLGGWWLLRHGATTANFFVLAAASMVVLGTLSALSVVLTRWGPKAAPVPPIRPGAVLNPRSSFRGVADGSRRARTHGDEPGIERLLLGIRVRRKARAPNDDGWWKPRCV